MTASRLDFRIDAQATGSQARAATFRTLHGEVATPLFMPVGTQAAVKAQSTERLVPHSLPTPPTGTDAEIRLTYRELTALIEDAVRNLK